MKNTYDRNTNEKRCIVESAMMDQLSTLAAEVCRTDCRAGARGCKDDGRPVITTPPDNIALASLAPLATPQLIN